ncbi:peptidase domain-containing ABC transporter [Priestia megaterium]|uniref:peptidase domain-containing ABC transporter n=1 Tax=Priestia megaterium TaxID=1404 RepID=UPI0036DB7BB1
MKKVPFIEQIEHSECGLACIAMILGYYNHNVSLIELREDYGVPKGGHTLSNLSEIAKSRNLLPKGYKADAEDLQKFTLPLVLHWEHKHFVVLDRISKKYFYITDPAHGKKRLTKQQFNSCYSGLLLTLTPTEGIKKLKKESSIKFLLNYAFKKPKLIFAILILTLSIQLLVLTVPFLTKSLTDNILVPNSNSNLTMMGLIILCLFIGYKILSLLRVVLIAKLQTAMDYLMMTNFMNHLLKLPFRFFENRSKGELIFRANSNVFIRQILSTRTVSFLVDSLLLFTYIFLMLRYSISMSLIVIGIGFLIISLLVLSSKVTKNLSNIDVNTQTKVQNLLTESITGITDVKMMGLEEEILSNWNHEYKKQLTNTQRKNIWSGSINAISVSFQFILTLFLLWYGAYNVIDGEMSIGTLLAFNTLAASFITPLISIGTGYMDLIVVSSFVQRLYDVLKAKPEKTNEHSLKLQNFKGRIEFKNVSFKYDQFSKNVVNNISFTVEPGEKIAIVGPSGSGKSTLAKLLLGLYTPTQGDILIDNHPVENLNLKDFRSKVGAVLQDAKLFNKSIYENIVSNNEKANIEDIILATKQANIYEDIVKLPLGLYTIVSENGVNFSGGQKQRIILARALAKKPSILVLDEATSALDSISEKKIEESIDKKLTCTTLIIAHRFSTVKNVDKIIVMDEGEIKEMGTQKELLENKKLYYKLYKNQIMEENNNENEDKATYVTI